jgi:hypothetical protein
MTLDELVAKLQLKKIPERNTTRGTTMWASTGTNTGPGWWILRTAQGDVCATHTSYDTSNVCSIGLTSEEELVRRVLLFHLGIEDNEDDTCQP